LREQTFKGFIIFCFYFVGCVQQKGNCGGIM